MAELFALAVPHAAVHKAGMAQDHGFATSGHLVVQIPIPDSYCSLMRVPHWFVQAPHVSLPTRAGEFEIVARNVTRCAPTG